VICTHTHTHTHVATVSLQCTAASVVVGGVYDSAGFSISIGDASNGRCVLKFFSSAEKKKFKKTFKKFHERLVVFRSLRSFRPRSFDDNSLPWIMAVIGTVFANDGQRRRNAGSAVVCIKDSLKKEEPNAAGSNEYTSSPRHYRRTLPTRRVSGSKEPRPWDA